MIRLPLAMLLWSTTTVLLSGCLVMSSHSERETGVKVGNQTLEQITPGETTEGWLLATLGEPTRREPLEGPADAILEYEHVEIREGAGAVFLIFAGSSEKRHSHSTFFEVRDGVVTKYWTGS